MGISTGHLLILLLVVILVFGTKKLRNMGGDLGSAFRNFKKAMSDGENEADKDLSTKPGVEAKSEPQATLQTPEHSKEHNAKN